MILRRVLLIPNKSIQYSDNDFGWPDAMRIEIQYAKYCTEGAHTITGATQNEITGNHGEM